MADERALAEFRMRVAMLRRQRWQQVEYSEDPPVALLFADADTQERAGGRRYSARSASRQPTWRKVWITDTGRVLQQDVPPPDEQAQADAEPEPAAAQAEAAPAPAEETPKAKPRAKAKAAPKSEPETADAPAKPASKSRVRKKDEPLPPSEETEEAPAPARRRKPASKPDAT